MQPQQKLIMFIPEEYNKLDKSILFPEKLLVVIPTTTEGRKNISSTEYLPLASTLVVKFDENNEMRVVYSNSSNNNITLVYCSQQNRWTAEEDFEDKSISSYGRADYTIQNGTQPKIRILNL